MIAPERPRERPRPSRGQIAARRLVAVVVLGGALAALGFVIVHFATRGSHKAAAPPGPARPFRIVFPEGFTRHQMAQRVGAVVKIALGEHRGRPHLSATGYLAASKPRIISGFGPKTLSLEGFLFPALYDFLPKTTNAQLIRDQLVAFRRNWAKVGLAYARSKNLTSYDVLKIASMIEKEAAVPAERRLIGAVIYNRLRERMPLGIDATIRYGLHISGTRPLSDAELHSSSPYNTRRFFGLPPTPIANPGVPSMIAAAHPARVDYLYFVRKPDHRHHYFTASYRAFVAHERAYGY